MGSRLEVPQRAVSWQQSLQQSVRTVEELLECLQLRADQVPEADRSNRFPLLVPREFIERMTPGDPQDPLFRQILPVQQENECSQGYISDPVGDSSCELAPGLLHKYATRVLMIASGNCAVHCRYCFRRHYPYDLSPKAMDQWAPALEYIAGEPSIDEVILSGGDPLSLGNPRLRFLVDSMQAIPRVRRLRIHTRFPVMIPSRVDDDLIALLDESRLQVWFVLHVNHVREIHAPLVDAMKRIRSVGGVVLNQAVLLRGINDTIEAQESLCRGLVDAGILPYYLHQLDRVAGAAHFACSEELGRDLVDQLRQRLPGYAIPTYVRESAGEASKTLIR